MVASYVSYTKGQIIVRECADFTNMTTNYRPRANKKPKTNKKTSSEQRFAGQFAVKYKTETT